MDDDDEGTGAEEVDTKRQSTRGSRGRVIVLDDDDEEDEEESAEAAPAGKEEVEANKENHAKHSRTAKAAAEEGVRPRAQKRKTGNKTAEGAPGKRCSGTLQGRLVVCCCR